MSFVVALSNQGALTGALSDARTSADGLFAETAPPSALPYGQHSLGMNELDFPQFLFGFVD